MQIIIFFIISLVTVHCQQVDNYGFRLDALRILNSGANGQRLHRGYSNSFNNELMNPFASNTGSNQANNLATSASNANNYAGMPNLAPMPQFSDGLAYPQNPVRDPIPQPDIPSTLGDYKKEDPVERIIAPGRLTSLNVPLNQIALPAQSQSLTANYFNDPRISGPNQNANLFDFELPQLPQPSRPMFDAKARIDSLVLPNGMLRNNMGIYTDDGQLNSNLVRTNNNAYTNRNLLSASSNDNFASFSQRVAATGNGLPVEISEYSTKIEHNSPLRMQNQAGPY